MSVVRGYPNKGNLYSNLVGPVKIDCQFTVNSSDSGGYGITSLKSNGYIQNIFMHTSATPATGSPNPASGDVLVVFNNNFNKYIGSYYRIQSPVTGSALTSTVNHTAYQIVSLGTATAAQWLAAGVPAGFTAAVGMSFIAIATGTIGGSATVKALGVSGVSGVEILGDPTKSISNSSIYVNGGAQVLGRFLGATSSSVTTLIGAAPADGSVVSMSFLFDNSSVTIDGL